MIATCIDNYDCHITTQIAEELIRVTQQKAPDQIATALEFLGTSQLQWIVHHTAADGGPTLRDETDQPILDAAISTDIDIIVTGDRDFHALDLHRPRVMTPAQFIADFLDD